MTYRDTKKTHHLNAHSGEALKKMFNEATSRANSHMQVCAAVCEVVSFVASKEGRFAFVSGVISAEGREFIGRNMAVLSDFTDHARANFAVPVMSAADVFHAGLLGKYRDAGLEGWALFWRKVLASGVGTLIMTPKWEISYGARDEHNFALSRGGIVVDYRHDDPGFIGILRKHNIEYTPDEEKIRAMRSQIRLPAPGPQ
jgi:hypothetical protein